MLRSRSSTTSSSRSGRCSRRFGTERDGRKLPPVFAPRVRFHRAGVSVSGAVVVWSLPRRDAAELMLLIAFALAMSGVLAARSVAAFFLAWEAMSLISAFLVAAQHERRVVRRATLTYLIVAQGGALCVLVALCILAGQAG